MHQNVSSDYFYMVVFWKSFFSNFMICCLYFFNNEFVLFV